MSDGDKETEIGNFMDEPAFVYQLFGRKDLRKTSDDDWATGPAPGALRVRSLFSALSPGTELAAYRGAPPLRPTKNIYPRLMGYCNVGEIVSAESEGGEHKVGDRVLTHAAHRTRFTIRPDEILAKLPPEADAKSASTTYLFHLGYNACLRADVRAGQNIAVIGLGTLGLTAAAVARMSGASVAGYSSHVADNSDYTIFGLDSVLSKELSGDSTDYDVVITTSNNWPDWELALQLARPGGKIAVIGFPGREQGQPDFNPLDSKYFYDKQLVLLSCGRTADLDVPAQDIRFTLKRNCAFLLRAVLNDDLPGQHLIGQVMPAGKLDEAYQQLASHREGGGTIVLDWTV